MIQKKRFYVVRKKVYDANGKFVVDIMSQDHGQVEPSIWAVTNIPEEDIWFTIVDKVSDVLQEEERMKSIVEEDLRLGRFSDLVRAST